MNANVDAAVKGRGNAPGRMVLILIVVSLLWSVGPVWAGSQIRIEMIPQVEIAGESVMLGEIAGVTGEDETRVRKLERIVIGKAPLPGETRKINTRTVETRLKQNGVAPADILLQGPSDTSVLRQYEKVSAERIQEVVRGFIQETLLSEVPGAKIKTVTVSHDAVLPKGLLTFRFKLLDDAVVKRSIPVHVHLYVDGEWIKKILAVAELEMHGQVVAARRSLKKGWIVGQEDITVKSVDVSDLPSNFVRDPAAVLGMRIQKTVSALQVFRSDMVSPSPLVKRGDIVQIVIESKRLRVRTIGEVKDASGCRGDRIRVINVDSQKGVYARVIDAKTVQVDYLE